MIKSFVSVMMVFSLSFAPQAFAQKGGKSETNATSAPRKHLSTIVFAGVAGAILGLSTLSFYGKPQEKLSHIAIGAAIGIIGGAMYTTFKAATEPKDFYNLRMDGPRPEAWDIATSNSLVKQDFAPDLSLKFEF